MSSRWPRSVMRPSARASVKRASPIHTSVRVAQVGLYHHIHLESRVGQAEINVGTVHDDPVVAPFGRHRGKRQLDDDAAIPEFARGQEPTDVPQQKAGIEVVWPVVAAGPALSPLPEALDEGNSRAPPPSGCTWAR